MVEKSVEEKSSESAEEAKNGNKSVEEEKSSFSKSNIDNFCSEDKKPSSARIEKHGTEDAKNEGLALEKKRTFDFSSFF